MTKTKKILLAAATVACLTGGSAITQLLEAQCFACQSDWTDNCAHIQSDYEHYTYWDETFEKNTWTGEEHNDAWCGACWEGAHGSCDDFASGSLAAAVLDIGLGRSPVANDLVNPDLVLEQILAQHAPALRIDLEEGLIETIPCQDSNGAPGSTIRLTASEATRVAQMWAKVAIAWAVE